MSGHAAIPVPTLSNARPGKLKGVVSTVSIVLLCLPSLVGATAMLWQAVILHRDMANWNEAAAALIALGSLLGLPLVATAAVIGGIISLTGVRAPFKYANLFVVALAALATLLLFLKLAK